MAIKITDECINCGACEPECPNNAIYESGVGWKYAEPGGFTTIPLMGDDGSEYSAGYLLNG